MGRICCIDKSSLHRRSMTKKKKRFFYYLPQFPKGTFSAVFFKQMVWICLYDILAEQADRGGHVGTEW
jgi:hypothetical protein